MTVDVNYLAILVAGAQFVQSYVSQGNTPVAPNIKPEKAQMMAMQKKMLLYFIPLLMASVAYSLPAAAGLYLLTNAFASLVQDVIVRRKLEKNATSVVAV